MSVSGCRALFLDRDGVINHDMGYTSSSANFQFIDGIFDLCREARRLGYLLIVVTNQGGIGRGYYSEEEFLTLTEWMFDRFDEEGAPITNIFYCPFHPEFGVGDFKKESFDRKPNPGMCIRAAERHNLSLGRSIMIGNRDLDMQAASNGGVGVRCHYLSGSDGAISSSAATHKIHSLREGIPLLNV